MRRSALAGQRLASLDAFRGITIAGMILVNNPGSSDYVYPLLNGSLAYAVTCVLIWLALMTPLYKKKILIKI